jgi:hypothetical protein
VLWREICYFASISRNSFTFQFIKQGLHDTPEILRKELQQAIDNVTGDCTAILIGYGLCGNGLEGIMARNTKLVIMRGHDCITFLLGSRERYKEFFDRHPGTYWYSPGWIELSTMPGKERHESRLQSYVEQYGKDTAEYLIKAEEEWINTYRRAVYVDLGFFDTEKYRAYTKECAQWLGWKCNIIAGDPQLIINFLEGDWNTEDFLIVEPGEMVVASYDDKVIDKKKVTLSKEQKA